MTILDIENFAKQHTFNETFQFVKELEKIGYHVSALSYNGFRVIVFSRWGSGVNQLYFNKDRYFHFRGSLGVIHYQGITQYVKQFIDNTYGLQRIWFNVKNGFPKNEKYHYKEYLKNMNNQNTVKITEKELREAIKESIKKILNKKK